MTATRGGEARRTAPLALWRYAHEYLRAARGLCREISVRCSESRVPCHIAAQGIEFALKAFLRARGATMAELRDEVGRSLLAALTRSDASPTVPELLQRLRADLSATSDIVNAQPSAAVFAAPGGGAATQSAAARSRRP